METLEFEKKALHAYERGRALLAAAWVVAVLVTTALVLSLSPERVAVVALGLPLSALLGGAAFRGQVLYAGARSGFIGGLFPLALALSMRGLGHACSIGGYCFSWCVVGCALGGVTASMTILKLAGRWSSSPAYWSFASFALLLTGSLACGCAGIMALGGLVVGFAIGMGPVRRLVLAH